MAESPVIETPRLRVLSFSGQYLTPRYVGWLNDLDVVRYSEQRHQKHTMESCRQYWNSFAGSPNFFWAVTLRENPRDHIGNMNAYVDQVNKTADVGILIGEKSVWKQGYGLEAWCAVCGFLLEVAGMRKVTAGTIASNAGMRSIMEKAGMVPDGRRIRHYVVNGAEEDVVHFAFFAVKS